MRISIRLTVFDNNFKRDYIEREIEVVAPDDTSDLFSQVKFGALVEEHLANAIDEYAKAAASPVATEPTYGDIKDDDLIVIGPLDQEVLQTEALEAQS